MLTPIKVGVWHMYENHVTTNNTHSVPHARNLARKFHISFQEFRLIRNSFLSRRFCAHAVEVKRIFRSTHGFHEGPCSILADNCKRGHLTFHPGLVLCMNHSCSHFSCVHTEHDPDGRWLAMSVGLAPVPASIPGDITDLRGDGFT